MTIKDKRFEIIQVQSGVATKSNDSVAAEEPLEIRIVFGPEGQRKSRSLSVTMRTPGHDFELAAGFLVSEGMVARPGDIVEQRYSGPLPHDEARANTVEVELAPDVKFELSKLQRHFYTTSSCGVCGKASIDAIRADDVQAIQADFVIEPALVYGLPDMLRKEQELFQRTGGLHAAGLVTLAGKLTAVREDVGRHNAVDKLIGCQLMAEAFPLRDFILVLSGRASFELVQKALLASIPVVVAVGAPSSLAVELAREFGLTLIGFTSKDRFNVYSGENRIKA